jgi:hypothetical protein
MRLGPNHFSVRLSDRICSAASMRSCGARHDPHQPVLFDEVRQVLGSVLGPDLHAKRIDSLCDATLGVLHSGSLAVAASATAWPPLVAC